MPSTAFWRIEARPLLGTMPDRNVALRCGTNTSDVCRWRNKLRIAPYRCFTQLRPGHRGVEAYLAILRQYPRGVRPSVLAIRVGVTRQAADDMCARLMRRGWVVKETQHTCASEPWAWKGRAVRYLVTDVEAAWQDHGQQRGEAAR